MKIQIVDFKDPEHRSPVCELWKTVFGYETAHNEPDLAIDKKVAHNDGLFFVALADEKVVGSLMAGYDGHRGWIYSAAVLPEFQKKGIGTQLLDHGQKKLEELGCLKVNLQILGGNEAVNRFYTANGYAVEDRISMGKKLY